MSKKYRFAARVVVEYEGKKYKMYQIEALQAIPLHRVNVGDLGGLVSHKKILSHLGNAWIAKNARVFNTGLISPTNGTFRGKQETIWVNEISDDAYIGGNATVMNSSIGGSSKIQDNARIINSSVQNAAVADSATLSGVILSGGQGRQRAYNTTVRGNSFIINAELSNPSSRGVLLINGEIRIEDNSNFMSGIWVGINEVIEIVGKAKIVNSKIYDSLEMSGDNSLDAATIYGKTIIKGNNRLSHGVSLSGSTKLTGTNHLAESLSFKFLESHDAGEITAKDAAKIKKDQTQRAIDSFFSAKDAILQQSSNSSVKLNENQTFFGIRRNPKRSATIPNRIKHTTSDQTNTGMIGTQQDTVEQLRELRRYESIIQEIESEYEAYSLDVVKLIKYPAMVDVRIPEIQEFVVNLRIAKRAIANSDLKKAKELSYTLEKSYCLAESVARTMASTYLSDPQKSSLKKANQLLTLACNEAASENERRSGFKVGLRALNGVIDIPEQAIENLRKKVGLLQLES